MSQMVFVYLDKLSNGGKTMTTEDLAEHRDRLAKLDKEIIDAIEELKAIKREKWSID